MATTYIAELLAVHPLDAPFFLGGYSFGGLVAFEMARQLQTQGCRVALLALLDVPSPLLSAPASVDEQANTTPTKTQESVKDYAQLLVEIAEELRRSWQKPVALSYDELSRLQPDAQLASALEQLREAQIVPDDMDIAQLRRQIHVIDAHHLCLQNYRPKPYSGRITLFCSEDTEVDPSLWASFSSEPIEVHPVSGDHFSMVAEPHVQALAVQLQQCLDRAGGTE